MIQPLYKTYQYQMPLPTSIEGITSWSPQGGFPGLYNQNFTVLNKQTISGIANPPVNTPIFFRAINVAVDLTQPSSARTITYMDIYGETQTYVCNYSGIHPFKGTGIISAGAAIVDDSLQMGV